MNRVKKPEDYEEIPSSNASKISPQASQSENEATATKDKLLITNFWKECVLISVSFLLLFMGYYPVSAVQSSLNNNDGLGTAALAAKYVSMVFGNLLLNNAIVDRLGCKWTLSIGMLMYSSYMAANFYPQWYTLVPAGILSGIGGSAMWNAQGTYLTRLCDRYILLNHPTVGETQLAKLAKLKARVFGLFNILYFGSNGLGNLASSLILPKKEGNDSIVDFSTCGAEYCNEILNSTSEEADQVHVYGLSAFCLASALIGVIILTCFVDQLSTLGISETLSGNRSIFYLLGATVRHWANPYQLLLIPLGLYNGMDGPFWTSEYTHAFVTCPLGIHYVGYTMMFYGFTVPVFVFLFSLFDKRQTRYMPYFIALLVHLAVLVTLLQWRPKEDDIGFVYCLSVVWGIGSGCWYPMMASFYSIIFRENKEAGFSNFHLWSTLGSALTYATSHSLCFYVKIFMMLGILIFGFICYFTIELHMSFTHRQDGDMIDITIFGQRETADKPDTEVNGITNGSFQESRI